MVIKDINIINFKSFYGNENYFNFVDNEGMIKLTGPVGAGKTALAEAILWGLYGSVKDHKNPNLISWGESVCTVEINLISKNKEINIKRSSRDPLEVKVNGKLLNASNKKDTQNVLEEFFDVPKLAVQRMCIISFSQFNSLAKMTPADTRLFLDEIFGFKTFTEFNDEIVIEKREQTAKSAKLTTLLDETKNQIEHLKQKKEVQSLELQKSFNTDELNTNRENLVKKGTELKKQVNDVHTEIVEIQNKISSIQTEINSHVQEFDKQLT